MSHLFVILSRIFFIFLQISAVLAFVVAFFIY